MRPQHPHRSPLTHTLLSLSLALSLALSLSRARSLARSLSLLDSLSDDQICGLNIPTGVCCLLALVKRMRIICPLTGTDMEEHVQRAVAAVVCLCKRMCIICP